MSSSPWHLVAWHSLPWKFAIALLAANGPWPSSDERDWGIPPPVAPFGLESLPSEHVVYPLIFPVLGPSRWKDGYGDLRGQFLHTGIDIRAKKMTPIVAPISGILGMKTMSFWIRSDDGWQILGTHLNDDNIGTHDHQASKDFMFAPDLIPGMKVYAGQFIGYLGESGDATAPHLHFELYAPGTESIQRRIRDPFPSLKAAQIINTPRISLQDPAARPKKGELRLVGCLRKVNERDGRITILLTAKQQADGSKVAVTTVRYIPLLLDTKTVEQIGGWSTLKGTDWAVPISVYIPYGSTLNDQRILRLLVPPELPPVFSPKRR